MRTIEEIEDMEITEGKTHDGESPCVLSAAELRLLISIAKAAHYRLAACEEGNQDSFAAADDMLDAEVVKARKVGMFGGGE